MAEVAFSNAAEADLVEIDEFSNAMFGAHISGEYMHGFDEAFALLRDFPRAAPLRNDLGNGIRCLVHRQHRIFYRLTGDAVLVVRVVHHAMDARRALATGLR